MHGRLNASNIPFSHPFKSSMKVEVIGFSASLQVTSPITTRALCTASPRMDVGIGVKWNQSCGISQRQQSSLSFSFSKIMPLQKLKKKKKDTFWWMKVRIVHLCSPFQRECIKNCLISCKKIPCLKLFEWKFSCTYSSESPDVLSHVLSNMEPLFLKKRNNLLCCFR